MKSLHFFFGAASALLLTLLCVGCASLLQEEKLSPSDLSVSEIEQRMNRAMDPAGRYAKASSYIQRQAMTVETFWSNALLLVELRYRKPDCFSLTVLNDNRPVSKLILNGERAWIADYGERRVTPVTGDDLRRLKIVYGISQPGSSILKLFRDVRASRCRIGDDDFYKLECTSPVDKESKFELYVGHDSFLTRQVRCDFRVKGRTSDYRSTSRNYTMRDGVMLPAEIEVNADGSNRMSHLIDFRLNAYIEDGEFLPPVFDND